MAIGVQRFDVDIQLENEGKIISTGQIKAGVKIDTVKEDGRYKVIVACSGEVLGYIREEDFHCKRHEEVQGTIRSLRWNSETGNASSATIRFTKNKEATPTVGE